MPHQLENAPAVKWHRRRWVRRAVALALLLTFGIGAALLIKSLRLRLSVMRDERQTLEWVMPADHVFAELPLGEMTRLMNSGQAPDINLMAHGRRAPGKPQRIVLVFHLFMERWRREIQPDVFGADTPILSATVLSTTTLTSDRMVVGSSLLESKVLSESPIGALKFYAGQPDPTDESHFTVDYETLDGRGTIDGWLLANDTVKFEVRTGPAAAGPAKPTGDE